jgi:arginine utilization protein RocB
VELIEKIMDGTGEKIKALAIELTQIRSVVGTEGEIAVAKKVYEYLAQLDYFQRNPRQLRLMPVKDDELGRLSVFAMIAGKQTENKDTLLCIGHIDTVGVADYGGLQDMATNPAQLKQSLATATKFSEPAFSELQSEDWLLGRGLLDMKTGVAALMVMVEEFSRQPEKLAGNLVFYAVPDEEGNSAGMLSAVADLAEMKAQRGWNFVAAIDTDFMTFRYPGDENRYVYVGTTGKLLPCFFIYGEETHVGEPFNGLDANLLASEVLRRIDLNPDLCDIADGEVALPPISLHQRDNKTEYSVQTANTVNLYFNYPTHCSEPAEVLAKCRAEANEAFTAVIGRLNQDYQKYCSLSHIPFQTLPWEVNVMTYDELYQMVKAEKGAELDQAIESLLERMRVKNADDREVSMAIVDEVHKHCSDKNSKIVVYFAPPYYPHNFVQTGDPRSDRLLSAVGGAVAEARALFDYSIVTRKFYPYISDLSYCGIAAAEHMDKLTENMPAWQQTYRLPVQAIQAISMPVVNIGPYGKDAHKLSERISVPYSFDAMPLILRRTIENLLAVN